MRIVYFLLNTYIYISYIGILLNRAFKPVKKAIELSSSSKKEEVKMGYKKEKQELHKHTVFVQFKNLSFPLI